jgi:hypothetical protein
MSEVEVKYFEAWNTSISMLFSKTPKIHMICGKCDYPFSKRFDFKDFRNGYPRVMCPNCYTVNYVPIVIE